MNLNIKNRDVHRMALELAKETGDSITAAVGDAIREKLERMHSRKNLARDIRRIVESMGPEVKNMPASWEIDDLLYDEKGLPK
jgi:antitoxin VapB